VAHLLHTLCRGKLTKVVCIDCPNTCAGTSGQTGAGDLAVRNVAPRLLAVAPFSTMDTPEELLRLDCATAAREIAALCHCSCFLCHHFFCPGSFRRCSHILRRSNCVTIIERAHLVCRFLPAHKRDPCTGLLFPIHAAAQPALAGISASCPVAAMTIC